MVKPKQGDLSCGDCVWFTIEKKSLNDYKSHLFLHGFISNAHGRGLHTWPWSSPGLHFRTIFCGFASLIFVKTLPLNIIMPEWLPF